MRATAWRRRPKDRVAGSNCATTLPSTTTPSPTASLPERRKQQHSRHADVLTCSLHRAVRRLGRSQLTQTRWSGGNTLFVTESTQIVHGGLYRRFRFVFALIQFGHVWGFPDQPSSPPTLCAPSSLCLNITDKPSRDWFSLLFGPQVSISFPAS